MRLHIYFDYTCPFCYVGTRRIRTLLKSFEDFEPVWHPFELRPKPTDRAAADAGNPWGEALAEEARKEGLELNAPFSPYPYTALAFQGMHFVASVKGDVETYNERVFEAVFRDGQDVGDIGVLIEIAEGMGLDAEAFGKALSEGLFENRQAKALRHAYFEAGVQEVPTYISMKRKASGTISREAMEAFLDECREAWERGR
ncbi:MAG: DsbA family protein, partial [Clostridiales Family XIII bacterium]|nr:DsbA family protein [Clostridiales Family XIII bacterium]